MSEALDMIDSKIKLLSSEAYVAGYKAGRASMKAEAAQIAVAAFGSATVRSDISTAILALED